MKQDSETVKLARHIFTSGRVIHDHVSRLKVAYVAKSERGRIYGNLSMQQMHAILHILKHGPVSMTEVADELGITAPSASVMIDRLVTRGILVRAPGTRDRRKVMVSVVAKVADDMQQLESAILASFVDLVEKIGWETARKWGEVLERVRAAIEQGDRNPPEEK